MLKLKISSYFYYSILDNDVTFINDNMIDNINKMILYFTDDFLFLISK